MRRKKKMSINLTLATDESLGNCSKESLRKLRVSDLRDHLSKRGFEGRQLKGKKADLVDRLYNVLHHSSKGALFTESSNRTAAAIEAAKTEAKEKAAAIAAQSADSAGSHVTGRKRGRSSPLDLLFDSELVKDLASRISDAKQLQGTDQLSTVEVEARLGIKRAFTDAEKQERKRSGTNVKTEKFEAGTSPGFWKAVNDAMQQYKGWKDTSGKPCSPPVEVTTYDILFDAASSRQRRERVRVEVNQQGHVTDGNSVIIKRKLGGTMDKEISGHYDLRIGLADEHPVSERMVNCYKESAEALFAPVSDINGQWELMQTGCALRVMSKVVLDSREGAQGVLDTDRILSMARQTKNELPAWLAQRMKWTLLNVGHRRSVDGHSLGKETHCFMSTPNASSALVDIACLPGKVFILPQLPPEGDSRWHDPANWHCFPMCAYKGRVAFQNVRIMGCSVRGMPLRRSDTDMESVRQQRTSRSFGAASESEPASKMKTPVEYRKKRRISYEVGNGMRLDLTRTQMSMRSIQDLDMAKTHYEVEFEIDFAKVPSAARSARDFEGLSRRFLNGVAHLMYSHAQ